MNRPCLNSPFHLIPSLILLSLSLFSPGLAAEVSLRAFTASFDLHKGSFHLATSEISLQQEGQLWRWRTTAIARGIYAWFIHSKPDSETTFIQADDEIRIQQIVNTVPGDEKNREAISFDWDKGSIDVFRKGKHKQLPLDAEVYDYHSIHLLAASMYMQQLDKATVNFYRKGEITRSDLVYLGTDSVDFNNKSVSTRKYEQTIVKSRSTLVYHYTAESPVLPIRIEKFRPGKSPVTLTLRKVDWNL